MIQIYMSKLRNRINAFGTTRKLSNHKDFLKKIILKVANKFYDE